METFLFTKHCEKEVNISISYKNQVTGQFHGKKQKHNFATGKYSPNSYSTVPSHLTKKQQKGGLMPSRLTFARGRFLEHKTHFFTSVS